MEEIKPINKETEIEVPKVAEPNMEKPKSLVEQVKELSEFKTKVISEGIKRKELKLPRGAKVKGRKLKSGYIGILRIDENGNLTGEKQKISGNSYQDKNGLYHATDGREILFWQGKFPVIIQKSWKNNPTNLRPENDKNETYGQPYIKARLLRDTIKVKSQAGGGIIIWILIGGAVLFGINYLMGGSLFG
jgi:hypothetical protein